MNNRRLFVQYGFSLPDQVDISLTMGGAMNVSRMYVN
jgi:hypothetical protein